MTQPAARSGFLPGRTVHLHPTARCNLACRHCYSFSSPQSAETLDADMLGRALAVLRGEGYEIVSLSGGEPLLYPGLGDLIASAKKLGFRVVAISNGYRIKPAFGMLFGQLDGIAISFDGMAEVHNRVRGHPRAFEAGIAALEHLRVCGIPSAAAYTVSAESMPDLPEFAERAAELGVRALQLRPLVMAGRAPEAYAGAALGQADLFRLFLVGAALAEAYAGEMAVHTDLAPGREIAAHACDYAALLGAKAAARPLAELVNPLVIAPDGAVRPLTYDFPGEFDLGQLTDLTEPGIAEMKRRRLPALAGVIRSALARARGDEAYIDWFAFCRDVAREGVGAPAA